MSKAPSLKKETQSWSAFLFLIRCPALCIRNLVCTKYDTLIYAQSTGLLKVTLLLKGCDCWSSLLCSKLWSGFVSYRGWTSLASVSAVTVSHLFASLKFESFICL